LVLAYLGDFKRKGWSVIGGAFAFGVCLIAFALANQLTVSLLFLFGIGFAIVTSIAVVNTLLQQLVTDQMRGRVMSMFILSFIGTMPFGNLVAGVASHRFGAPRTLAAGGCAVVLYAIFVALTNKGLRELH
jgi:MFS family permease